MDTPESKILDQLFPFHNKPIRLRPRKPLPVNRLDLPKDYMKVQSNNTVVDYTLSTVRRPYSS